VFQINRTLDDNVGYVISSNTMDATREAFMLIIQIFGRETDRSIGQYVRTTTMRTNLLAFKVKE